MGCSWSTCCDILLSIYLHIQIYTQTLRLAGLNTSRRTVVWARTVFVNGVGVCHASHLSLSFFLSRSFSDLTSHCFYHCLSLKQALVWHTAPLIPHDKTLTHSTDSAKSFMRHPCLWYHCFYYTHLFVVFVCHKRKLYSVRKHSDQVFRDRQKHNNMNSVII